LSREHFGYIYFDTSKTARSTKTYACDPEEAGGQFHLDFDDDGRLIGIEVLDASRKLPKAVLKAGVASD
jgi:uncharacterized protein YuzE